MPCIHSIIDIECESQAKNNMPNDGEIILPCSSEYLDRCDSEVPTNDIVLENVRQYQYRRLNTLIEEEHHKDSISVRISFKVTSSFDTSLWGRQKGYSSLTSSIKVFRRRC